MYFYCLILSCKNSFLFKSTNLKTNEKTHLSNNFNATHFDKFIEVVDTFLEM